MKETELIDTEIARSSLHKDVDELSKIFFSILRTTRLKSFQMSLHKMFIVHC